VGIIAEVDLFRERFQRTEAKKWSLEDLAKSSTSM